MSRGADGYVVFQIKLTKRGGIGYARYIGNCHDDTYKKISEAVLDDANSPLEIVEPDLTEHTAKVGTVMYDVLDLVCTDPRTKRSVK